MWADGGAIGFGHTMLRTTREAAGEHQPVSLEGRLWITADPESIAERDCSRNLAQRAALPAPRLPILS